MAATNFIEVCLILCLILKLAQTQVSTNELLRNHFNQTENQFEYLNADHHQQLVPFEPANNRIHYNQPPSSKQIDINDQTNNFWNNGPSLLPTQNQKTYSISSQSRLNSTQVRNSLIMPPNNDINNSFFNSVRALPPALPPTTSTTTTSPILNSVAEPQIPVSTRMINFEQQNPSTRVESWPMHGTVYEGPATAPPPDDYYFTSTESLQSSKASNIWWAIGAGHGFEVASNLTPENYLDFCSKSNLLVSQKQRSLCRSHPKIMHIVAKGLKMAIEECQSRFESSRWNCSLVVDPLIASENNYQLESVRASRNLNQAQNFSSDKTQIFGEVMNQPNREKSFLNAIIAAGIAHAVTKACSQGELPEECSCDKKIKSENTKGKIEWVGCSDDIYYGARLSRDFTDSVDTGSDPASMISSHNYEVGRRIFKMATDITCSCQTGENGLCTTKRCWRHLSPFKDIGDELIKRYDRATHVQPSNKGGDSKTPVKLRPVKRGVRKPRRKDLVYIEESPDFCSAEPSLGILGTQNRRCNSTSNGLDECRFLCCGRGYQTVLDEVEEDCNCKFVWCCEIKCRKCRRQIISEVCN